MGFTIEDMLVVAKDRYKMTMQAGRNGWSNSISWLIMLEDLTILNNFSGKELAVTTGLGFDTTEKQLALIKGLMGRSASGLIVNTGKYIPEIPQTIIQYCDENDFPLLTVPWDVYLVDMIKDISVRVFLQGSTDQQISTALIHAIEAPGSKEQYLNQLLPFFDTDGKFQAFLITTDGLDEMDTVERRRMGYRMQLYLMNITHNGHFFYYNSDFVLIMNAVEEKTGRAIIRDFLERAKIRMPGQVIRIGGGSQVTDISNLYVSYQRAKAAVTMAADTDERLVYFDEMGIYRMLYSVQDKQLLREMCDQVLAPLLEYDRQHNANYVDTLDSYLRHSESIQAVAEEMYTHRNTIMYRINNIKKLLDNPLRSEEEKLPYQMACLIRHMKNFH